MTRFPRIEVRFVFVIFGLLPLAGLFASYAFGQSRTTSALAGRVEDQNGVPIPTANVEISSEALIGSERVANTDSRGRFRFSEIPPGEYDITVTMKGYKTFQIEDLHLSVGMTGEVPIKMTLYAGEERVEVRGKSEAIDPTTSSRPTILSSEYLENIPSDRDISHILNFAPGINVESAYGGAEESGIAYQMDGVDISDPQGGSPWASFNYSLIDEVQLIGLGAPAEYGQFTGVVFNTVTKSGSNEFSGFSEFFYTGNGLTSSGSEDLVSTIEDFQEGTLQVGGPIVKNKLWYFGSAQYVRDLRSEGGPIETQKDPRAFLKLTFQTSQNSILEGWVEYAHTKITGRNGDAFTPLEATTGEDNPEVVGNISWKSALSENTGLSIAYGGFSGYHHFDPYNGFDIPGHVDAETGFASVNAAQFGIVNRNRNQINVSLTHHAANFLGYHDFKFGAELEHSEIHDIYGYSGGAFFSDNEGPEQDPSTEEDDFFTLAFIGGGYNARGTNKRVSLFAQDSWRITPSFTLNPGVRLDINRGEVTGGNTVFETNPIAPRIGFAWDIGAKEESILRAHYGRYYEALYASFYYYMDPGAFNPLTKQRIFNTSGYTDTLTSVDGQKYAMDPNIKQPHLDEYILGFDQQLPLGIALSGTLIYRKNSDFIETVSQDGIFVPVQGIVPDTGQKITLYDYLNTDTATLLYTNPKGLNRTYRGLIITGTRRFNRNWQMWTSYVYSKARGNIDNLGFDETGLGGNTPFFDGHFLDTPNSLVNAQGRLTHDQTHQVKLQGTYEIPSINLSISANYTYHTGDTWTPISDCVLTDDGNGVIGDGILDCHEFPQGPVTYFAEARGSQRLPARNEIDLHAEWQHNVGQLGRIALEMDIFNLNNQTRVTEVEPLVGEELGQPATINFPRNIRFGISFSW